MKCSVPTKNSRRSIRNSWHKPTLCRKTLQKDVRKSCRIWLNAKSSSNKKSGKTSLSAGVGIFDFLKAASANGSDSFSAQGSKSDTNKVAGNVTVTVTQVMPNGNMVVEGTQSIWQNRDEHKITFRGVCRQDDVTANNTIPSTKIADATVRFDGKGPLNAKQRQGILTQIFNILF